MSTAQLTASRVWHDQHYTLWSTQSASATGSADTKPSRLLLQASEQSEAGSAQSLAGVQQHDSAGGESVSAAVQAAVVLADNNADGRASHTVEQPEISQYQRGSSAIISNDRLMNAAAAQASQYLTALPGAATRPIQTSDLDTWPLVEPDFKPALHEV